MITTLKVKTGIDVTHKMNIPQKIYKKQCIQPTIEIPTEVHIKAEQLLKAEYSKPFPIGMMSLESPPPAHFAIQYIIGFKIVRMLLMKIEINMAEEDIEEALEVLEVEDIEAKAYDYMTVAIKKK